MASSPCDGLPLKAWMELPASPVPPLNQQPSLFRPRNVYKKQKIPLRDPAAFNPSFSAALSSGPPAAERVRPR